MRPETQKQQTDANSRIKTSAAERVFKISEIYAKAGVLIEVKIFQDWTLYVSTVFDVLSRFCLCEGFPVVAKRTASKR